jgi:allantoate deiminase
VSAAAARVMARADELGACSERPGEITRRYGTPALVAARDRLEAWMLGAGMRTRVDRVGNLIGTLGSGGRPALVMGSHFDTVVDAGRYDGTLGVLVGIGCAEELAGADPVHDLTVVAFCDEEGARYPTAYFGSRAFLGEPLPGGATADGGGATLAAGIEVAGNAAAEPGSGLPANAAAYLEAHIEQGPVLEAAGHPLGIVTAITGGVKLTVTLAGTAGHAGTVPMGLRRDAFSAAAEIALAVERLARDYGEAVATVGQVAVSPGVANVIPGRATISIDLRHPDDERRGRLHDRVREIVASVAERRDLDAAIDVIHDERSVVCDPALGARMREAARAIGLDPPSLPSGAGHDAVVLSDHVPVAMLFVRCAGGISHNPAESVTTDDVAAALAVLTAVVRDPA